MMKQVMITIFSWVILFKTPSGSWDMNFTRYKSHLMTAGKYTGKHKVSAKVRKRHWRLAWYCICHLEKDVFKLVLQQTKIIRRQLIINIDSLRNDTGLHLVGDARLRNFKRIYPFNLESRKDKVISLDTRQLISNFPWYFLVNTRMSQNFCHILVCNSLQYVYHMTKAVQEIVGICCGGLLVCWHVVHFYTL